MKLHVCRDNGGWFTPLPNQPKLHHFLPAAYLRRFADERGDYAIDLGPEGGHAGGRAVVIGTPEHVARCKASHTGRFLKSHRAARG